MRTIVPVLVAFCLTVGSMALANAETFSVDLPGLIGSIGDRGGLELSNPFDFGVQFSRVDQVRMVVTGDLVPFFLPLGQDQYEVIPSYAYFNIYDQSGTEQATFAFRESFGTQDYYTRDGWDFLLNGKGTVTMIADVFASPALVDVRSARLEISGVSTPEPVTLSLLALGSLLLVHRRQGR